MPSRLLREVLDGPPGVLKLKVSAYPALLVAGGSVQINFLDGAYPLLVNRGAGNAFYAMDSDCQHLNCIVPTYNATAGYIQCGCHGSRYAIDGSRVRGPTTRGLNTFPASFDGTDTVNITIPGLRFGVTQIAVEAVNGPMTRLRLQADIVRFARYQVTYRAELNGTPAIAPIATTATGAANATSGYASTTPITVFVDASGDRGFYTIELLATPYV